MQGSIKEDLIRRLDSEGFPAFRDTVRMVGSISYDTKESLSEFARKIICDPGMSIKLIQMANSPVFNPGIIRVKTVTKAILMLGFRNVVSIALSLALIEDILKINRERRKSVIKKILEGIMRATIAKKLASTGQRIDPEEAYLAALFFNLGDIVLDIFVDRDLLVLMHDKVHREGISLESARREVLGFSAKDLTKEINARWNLSALLANLDAGSSKSFGTLCIEMADFVVKSKDLQIYLGLTSEKKEEGKFRVVIDKIASSLGISHSAVEKMIREGLHESREILATYTKIFGISLESGFSEPLSDVEEVGDKRSSFEPWAIDFKLLTGIANEIVGLVNRGFEDPHLLFSLTLEALYNGLGMDVVLFFLISNDRGYCYIRHYLIRPHVKGLLLPEHIPISSFREHIFSYMMDKEDPLWVSEESEDRIVELARSPLISSFISLPFFVAPISPKGRPVGFIYADRRARLESPKVVEDDFVGFSLFARLASMGLKILASKR